MRDFIYENYFVEIIFEVNWIEALKFKFDFSKDEFNKANFISRKIVTYISF